MEKGAELQGARANEVDELWECLENKSNLGEKIHEHATWCRRRVSFLTQTLTAVRPFTSLLSQFSLSLFI